MTDDRMVSIEKGAETDLVDLLRRLKASGRVADRVSGSPNVLIYSDRPGHNVVAHPIKDLGKGFPAAIRK
ncbi:MAG: hypothetical protein RH945_09225 [Hyphomonas sp.]